MIPTATEMLQRQLGEDADVAAKAKDLEKSVRQLAEEQGDCDEFAGQVQIPRNVLSKHVFLEDERVADDEEDDCILEATRPSGTDLRGSKIRELKTPTAQLCQEACQKDSECQHFLYFSKRHYQRFKHNTCRLLREKGEDRPDQAGHVSGPKVMDSNFK